MFKFLLGVAFGAGGYWAWQSFGRDLLGLGSDQDTSYGGYNSGVNTSFSSGTSGASSFGTSGSTPSTPSTSSTPASSESAPRTP